MPVDFDHLDLTLSISDGQHSPLTHDTVVTAASAGHGLMLWWPAGYPSANNNAATFITEHRLADKATLVWSRESDTLADKIMAFIVLRDESKDKLNRRRYRHFDFVTKLHAGSEWLLG